MNDKGSELTRKCCAQQEHHPERNGDYHASPPTSSGSDQGSDQAKDRKDQGGLAGFKEGRARLGCQDRCYQQSWEAHENSYHLDGSSGGMGHVGLVLVKGTPSNA